MGTTTIKQLYIDFWRKTVDFVWWTE